MDEEGRKERILGTDYKERIRSRSGKEETEAEMNSQISLISDERQRLVYDELTKELDSLCLEKEVDKKNLTDSYEDKFTGFDFENLFKRVKKIVEEINKLSAKENQEKEQIKGFLTGDHLN